MKFKYAEQDLAVYGHDVSEDISTVKPRLHRNMMLLPKL